MTQTTDAALVGELRRLHTRLMVGSHSSMTEAADTIEAQARRIEALEAIATGRWSSDARGYDLACEAIAEIKRIRAFALAALAPTKAPTPLSPSFSP